MEEPLSVATLGSTVLTEGIKFLYSQAGDVLRRWRERREKNGTSLEEARLQPPDGLLAGAVEPLEPRDDYANRLEDDLLQARRLLADYADGIDTPKPGDHLVMMQVDALRRLLEAVYGQRITFQGEQRPLSGPLVIGEIDAERIAGEAVAVRAAVVSSGEVRGSAKATRVEEGGRLAGVEVKRIG